MPEFRPGEAKTAVVETTNLTARALECDMSIRMGTDMKIMASTLFDLNPGESKDVSIPVVMPSLTGTYPTYIDVLSEGELVGRYKMDEDVVIAEVSPPIAGYPETVGIILKNPPASGTQWGYAIWVDNVGRGTRNLAMNEVGYIRETLGYLNFLSVLHKEWGYRCPWCTFWGLTCDEVKTHISQSWYMPGHTGAIPPCSDMKAEGDVIDYYFQSTYPTGSGYKPPIYINEWGLYEYDCLTHTLTKIGLPPAGAVFWGYVFNEDNKPVANAVVNVGGILETTTDKYGRYEIHGINLATYQVVVSAPNYHPISITISLEEARWYYKRLCLYSLPLPIGKIVSSSWDTEPKRFHPHDEHTIVVTVQNTGSVRGEFSIHFQKDEETVGKYSSQLNPGETFTKELTTSFEAGYHRFRIFLETRSELGSLVTLDSMIYRFTVNSILY